MRRAGWALGVCAALAGLYPTLEVGASRVAYALLASGAEEPASADVIVVFGGGGGGRIARGLELLRQGYAPRILFLGTGPEMEFAHSQAVKVRDWAPGRIRFGEKVVHSTAQSARHLAEWARNEGVQRALVISDADHLGRVRAQMDVFARRRFHPQVVASGRAPSFDHEGERRDVLREAVAYVMVRLGALLRPDLGVGGLPPGAALGA
jgi:uncharacterized SAM-binding protein YcdF (DUF218 family)